ncbi:MAG TPA: GAF domain-containing protein, partial [Gemmatimonadales bacterium]|nr:GAF domain-containing protein [Gemmatimonadales bacterium]
MSLRPIAMNARFRARVSAAAAVRMLVSAAAVVAFAAGLGAYASGRMPVGAGFGIALVAVVLVGALTRRFGIALPGAGFSSYILGVMFYAILARGWPFAALTAPFAMVAGDVFLRRLPLRAALTNAAHLTSGVALAGLLYQRIGGATGLPALGAPNVPALAALALVLALVVNGTFYLELALARTGAWANRAMTLRWEGIVTAASMGLALGWLRFTHAELATGTAALIFAALLGATLGSAYVIRLGVRADELRLIQRLAQTIAGDINLARSFPRIQELTRTLVPWEHMGFARYDPRTREMELIVDTSMTTTGGTPFRFDADAGLTGEVVRLRQPVVARGLARDQVVLATGGETPGAEVLVPLYHAGQLVGIWSVRHSDPRTYRDSDGDLLNLLAPQLALMLAFESSVQPVVGASDQ